MYMFIGKGYIAPRSLNYKLQNDQTRPKTIKCEIILGHMIAQLLQQDYLSEGMPSTQEGVAISLQKQIWKVSISLFVAFRSFRGEDFREQKRHSWWIK